MQTLQKIETYLPIFSGFYNTIWQYDDESAIYFINQEREEKNLNNITWEHLEIDYPQYEEDIVKGLCDIIQDKLSDYVEKIELQKIQSPKEYNFKNDSVDVIIIPKIENIQKFIYDNKKKFKEYLKNRYTSYDGFISHYDNDMESWEADTNNFTNWDVNGHYLGSILDFISNMLEIKEIDLYYDVEIDNLGYITNLDDILSCFTCNKCNEIIKDDNIINSINKYKDIMKKYPNKILCSECLENI